MLPYNKKEHVYYIYVWARGIYSSSQIRIKRLQYFVLQKVKFMSFICESWQYPAIPVISLPGRQVSTSSGWQKKSIIKNMETLEPVGTSNWRAYFIYSTNLIWGILYDEREAYWCELRDGPGCRWAKNTSESNACIRIWTRNGRANPNRSQIDIPPFIY